MAERYEEEFEARRATLVQRGRAEEARSLEEAWEDGAEGGMLEWLVERARPKVDRTSGNRAYGFALLLARLGQVDQALEWLNRAIEDPGGFVIFASVHPWFDSLRSDRRFSETLARMGLS